jgi:tetratricopeptide (TPR) repeat protein
MREENELAQAELIALAADLPPDPALRIRVASLLADADAHRRALPIFEQVLKADPASRAALAGAGTAAFHLEDYRAAAAYLRRAVTAGADGDAALMLETSRFVLDLDPYRRGLPARERAARALRLLRVARTRLASCIGSTGDTPAIRDEVQTTLQRSRPAVIARDPDRLDAVAALAFRAARAVDDRCGPPASPLERALHLLHTRYGESPP